MRFAARIVVITALFALSAEATLGQTADEIVEKYLSALGGRAALEKVTSRHTTGTVTVSTPAGDLTGTVEIFNQAPNKSRSVMNLDLSVVGMGNATIDQRFDGEAGYILDPLQGNRDITGNPLENLRNTSFPTPFLDYKARGAAVELVRKDTLDSGEAYVVLLRPKSGSVLQCFFNVESHLLVKTVVVVNVPQIGDLQQTTDLLDYRAQDGIQMPFQLKNSSSVQTYTITVTKAEHNVPLDKSMFSKPAADR